MSLKIGGKRQSIRQILIQQDMAWWFVRIAKAMDTFTIIQNASFVQSAGALDSLKPGQKKMRIFPLKMIKCQAYVRPLTPG